MAASAISFGTVLHAQDNPWGLVYEEAITENTPGKVNIHPVKYDLDGIEVAANVYTPAGYNPDEKEYPAIIVAHPNGGTKEQVAGLFAQRMAERGYITIAADASYQGASGGEPRHTDKPYFRINDIHGMADYISKYPGVDPQRIGAFGIAEVAVILSVRQKATSVSRLWQPSVCSIPAVYAAMASWTRLCPQFSSGSNKHLMPEKKELKQERLYLQAT